MTDIVCFVPIRLNSVRIREKSIVDVFDRPMFCWALETLDKLDIPVYVYSNDHDILREKLDFMSKNIHFLERQKYLDTNFVQGIDIYRSFAQRIKSDCYLLAHCTSPFVSLQTYKETIEAVVDGKYNSSCTVEKKQTFAWYHNESLNFTLPRKKTQDIEPIYFETSAAYCFRREVLETNSRTCAHNNCLIYTSGIETIDIDDYEDLNFLNQVKLKAANIHKRKGEKNG